MSNPLKKVNKNKDPNIEIYTMVKHKRLMKSLFSPNQKKEKKTKYMDNINKLREAISQIIEQDYIALEEAVLKAEMAWNKLLVDKLAQQEKDLAEKIRQMKKPLKEVKPDIGYESMKHLVDLAKNEAIDEVLALLVNQNEK